MIALAKASNILSGFSEKIKEEKFNYSDQEIKNYFPDYKVIEGLFKVVESIYGIHIKKIETEVWHSDVKFYRIQNSSKKYIPFKKPAPARRVGLLFRKTSSRKECFERIASSIQVIVFSSILKKYFSSNFSLNQTEVPRAVPSFYKSSESACFCSDVREVSSSNNFGNS